MINSPLAIGIFVTVFVGPVSYGLGNANGREVANKNVQMVQFDLSTECKTELDDLWRAEMSAHDAINALPDER